MVLERLDSCLGNSNCTKNRKWTHMACGKTWVWDCGMLVNCCVMFLEILDGPLFNNSGTSAIHFVLGPSQTHLMLRWSVSREKKVRLCTCGKSACGKQKSITDTLENTCAKMLIWDHHAWMNFYSMVLVSLDGSLCKNSCTNFINVVLWLS